MRTARSLAVLTVLLASGSAEAVASDQPVASDGGGHVRLGAPLSMVAPTLGFDEVSPRVIEATGASLDEPADAAPTNGLATVATGNPRGGRSGRSIIGWDSRLRVHVASYPSRAIVYITRDGFHFCSGWMIGADTVATAGHCVHAGGGGAANFHPVRSFRVYPGYDGSGAGPYGSCTVRRAHTVTGWSTHASPEYDYGALKLNCTIGRRTGTFGYYVPTRLIGQPMIMSGYPGDKPRTQWLSADLVRTVRNGRAYYRADTVGGQSGGPIWNDRHGALMSTGAWAFGIHAYGENSQRLNSGVWIRQEVFNNLTAWRDAP